MPVGARNEERENGNTRKYGLISVVLFRSVQLSTGSVPNCSNDLKTSQSANSGSTEATIADGN